MSTLSNIDIPETSRPVAIKFYLKHHWGGGKAEIVLGLDKVGTRVSMATEVPIGLYWGTPCGHSSAFIFDRVFFILAGNKDYYNISNEFEFQPDSITDCGVSCPGMSRKIPIDR